MSLRDSFAGKSGLVAAVVASLLVVGAIAFAIQRRGSSDSIAVQQSQAFFSVDDGKTWFADDAAKIPPFDKDGKQAVRAYVFQTANGTKFVNYLERFIPEAKRALEAAAKPADPTSKPVPGQNGPVQAALVGGREIKRPGDAKWINAGNYKEAAKITAIKAPNGQTDATPFEP